MDAPISCPNSMLTTKDMAIGRLRLSRVCGMAYGFGNQILFLVTVWYLFWFLRDGAINQLHEHW
ncbi:MAG: hypothetical protein IT423_13345, partial [Pirellulaceae bacterium]|nr:hypothetical protein [Pirellulaceae bacterium]